MTRSRALAHGSSSIATIGPHCLRLRRVRSLISTLTPPPCSISAWLLLSLSGPLSPLSLSSSTRRDHGHRNRHSVSVCSHAAARLVGAWPMRRHLLALCLFLASPAFAATWTDGGGWKTPQAGANPDGVYTVLPDMHSPNNTHVTTCSTSSCTRAGDLPAPVGRGNPRLAPAAVFPKVNIAVAALSLGSRVLPWLVVGKGLYDWFNSAGVRNQAGNWEQQTTQDTSTYGSGTWRCNGAYAPCNQSSGYGTPDAACRSAAALAGGTYVGAVAQNGGASYVCQFATGTKYAVYKSGQCGFGTADATGVCPYTAAWVPATETQAHTKLANANITADVLKKALEEVLKAGASVQDSGSHSVTGPSSVPGETKTKTVTAANGTTQVTTVTNNYNYNYAGNTITITTTEVIQNPDGSTETDTSNTPDPLCAENPNSLACVKLGDVPTDSPVWETKTIAYQADSLGLPAACPAPWTAQLRGWTLSMSYQPACDVAPQIRLGLLALSTLGALLMIITTVRT